MTTDSILTSRKKDQLEKCRIDGETYFKINQVDKIRPFFMTIVSDSNHWMFLSSNGGITMGRKNAEFALFPYYTDDKITENYENTGSKTIFKVIKNGELSIWEPFSVRNNIDYQISRNLYKNQWGNSIIFEEIHHDLELTFSYQWSNSNDFGFIKTSKLVNNSYEIIDVTVLDGMQNILPYGIGSALQTRVSNLGDAYKRTELVEESGLGILALSAIIVDKAEPSEALKANTVFSLGLENPKYLLSSLQLDEFRKGNQVTQETDIKGERGAYFIVQNIKLNLNEEKKWSFVLNVNQTQSEVIELNEQIKNDKDLLSKIHNNVNLGTKNLKKIIASSDGLQTTFDEFKDSRHFSNTLFNCMRGGIFDNNYQIEKWDFSNYLKKANIRLFNENQEFIGKLPDVFSVFELKERISSIENHDLHRLSIEYLPLMFSRRHGDPSRPWNRFSINTINENDGSKILDYEGNWRDIFQNWEALAHSFPHFLQGMIYKFLNASTFDGYNPYRVTKDGFDWETIEPDDPWSYIGYWGDHQIIYLLKFLEISEDYFPNSLTKLLDKEVFVYANVPYQIKSYDNILINPKDTIDFDHELDAKIHQLKNKIGADGALHLDEKNQIVHVNFTEKILATVLSKLSNLVLDGGIWMNTQRPEWNDANNALVGNGVSMVTLYYLRRFVSFFIPVLENSDLERIKLSNEMVDFYKSMRTIFENHLEFLENNSINNKQRKEFLDEIGYVASQYRNHIYEKGFWGNKRSVSREGIIRFFKHTLSYLEKTIESNKRQDGLYHAYNLITINDSEIEVSHLNEMLEGQVAILSSKYLSAKQALNVLDALKKSALFRANQYSYLLYPNKNLKGFLERNVIPEHLVLQSKLLQQLLSEKNRQIIEQDVLGNYHFNGNFTNANDLQKGLNELHKKYELLKNEEQSLILQIFEEVFNHKAFTGRSGTFYGYEGLGSIYWHMVSKLLLAVYEVCFDAVEKSESDETIGRLLEHFYEIYEGIGVHKSPELYGAFSTDAYSHTPYHRGAQQPGMTGQVKEDILSRFGELGIFVKNGKTYFIPNLLRKNEFLQQKKEIEFFDVNGNPKQLKLNPNSLFFTKCQVPVIYQIADCEQIEVVFTDDSKKIFNQNFLDETTSNELFKRNGNIKRINIQVKEELLK